ncbi:MAG TPA: NAD(+) synthase [Candidatus Baltobacteraceae bacterium]|nr:NAD(+) synthase [Candidatus Baltobacteraceae bacterium]
MLHENFLDIRNHGCKRTAVIVPRVHVADPTKNAEEHIKMLDAAYADGAQLAVCPELGLTGYSCKDLFRDETLRASALEALDLIRRRSERWPEMLVVVGLPLAVDGMMLANAGVVLLRGLILGVAAKTYLPNYGEFEEKRWFKEATKLTTRMVDVLGRRVPIGNDLLFVSKDDPDFVLHVEICEDLWKPIPPSAKAALAGATVFANLSASNAVIGKAGYRRDLVENASGKYIGAYLYAAAGFGEDVSDLGWDGHGMIAERGSMLAETKRFVREGEMILADLNLRAIVQDRLREETHADNAADHRFAFRKIAFGEKTGARRDLEPYKTFRRRIDPMPFVPRDPASRDTHCREAFNIVSSCLLKVLDQLPEGRRSITLGVSGGLDSTLAALFAAYALDEAKLPRTQLKFLTLPGFGTTDGTYQDALALMRLLGSEAKEISIKEISMATFDAVGHDMDRKDVVYENVQAWTRKHLLFANSAEQGGIVLGTGDLSEGMVGWCTLYADHVSHYHVNAGIPKTLIRSLIEWIRDRVFVGSEHAELREVLTRICGREISPELLPPDKDGKIAQKTNDTLGPEDLRDFFAYWTLRFGFAPSFITRMALQAFDGTYDLATIKKWHAAFLKRFFWSQFKRSTAPLGPKVGSVALSQRGDWRMPTSASVSAWIAELERGTPA